MTARAESSRAAAVGRSLRWRARARFRTRGLAGQTGLLALLSIVAVLACVPIIFIADYTPVSLLLVPLVIAGLVLGPRSLPWFVVFVLTLTVVAVVGRRL